MLLNRILRFVRKRSTEKQITIRFFTRKALAKLPLLPIRSRLNIAPGKELRFWWSYLPKEDHPGRALLEYWGDDCGELCFLWQFLESGMVFFDVGAYHGIFSIIAAMKLSSPEQVVAFEPSPRERRRFQFHATINGLSGIRLEPYAVSSATGTLNFFTVASLHTSMNSLHPPAIELPLREIVVDAVSLDEYLQRRRLTQVDIMKIDVEGAEMEAFRGAQRMLRSTRPIMICEVLDWVTRPWGYTAREIISCLHACDYVWFDFHDDGEISPHEPRDAYPETQNYLAVPREKLSAVKRWRRA